MPIITQHFPLDDASAEGHFPGNPIIPGAVLLADALRAIAAATNLPLLSSRVKTAKFFHPVRPGDVVEIDFTQLERDAVKLNCTVNGKTVLTAHAVCGE